MSKSASSKTFLQRARPWLVAWGFLQVAVRVGGAVLAQRLDSGDDASARQRRVKAMGQLVLRPTSQELSRLQFDLAMAGLDLDLTQARPGPGGVDITLNCVMAGANVRVPSSWRVASESRGVGGVGEKPGRDAPEPLEPTAADVRVHLNAVFGGVNVEHVDG